MLESAFGRFLPNFFRLTGSSTERRRLEVRHGRDVAIAWSLFRVNWLILAVLLAVFDLSLVLTDFRIRPTGYLVVLAAVTVYGVSGHLNAQSARHANPRVFAFLTGFAQTVLGVSVLVSLSYVATSANLPLQDANLLAIDRGLGFDFRRFLTFVDQHEWLTAVLAFGYRSIAWMICIVISALPLLGYCHRLAEFVFALMLSLTATCCITTVVPAIGAYEALGLVPSDYPNIIPSGYYDTAREMPLIRDRALRLLDVSSLIGVVTFPSFHAAAAVLYTWALWPWRWFRPVNATVNGAMLIATPIGGGHFLVDVLAGIAVAVSAVCLARLTASRLALERTVRSPIDFLRTPLPCQTQKPDLRRSLRAG